MSRISHPSSNGNHSRTPFPYTLEEQDRILRAMDDLASPPEQDRRRTDDRPRRTRTDNTDNTDRDRPLSKCLSTSDTSDTSALSVPITPILTSKTRDEFFAEVLALMERTPQPAAAAAYAWPPIQRLIHLCWAL